MPAPATHPPATCSDLTPFGEGSRAWLVLAPDYVEIHPMRSLRLMGGNATPEAGSEGRSRD